MHYITVTESKTWLPLNHQTKRESLSSSQRLGALDQKDKSDFILFYIL